MTENEIQEEMINVNLSNNLLINLKRFGLNQNKRGKLKDEDYKNLKDSIMKSKSKKLETYMN